MTLLTFSSPTNEISINPESRTIVLNGRVHHSDAELSNEKGRATLGRHIVKYSGNRLTLYLDKISIDVCIRKSGEPREPGGPREPGEPGEPEGPLRTFYITASRSLDFYPTSKKVHVNDQLLEATQVSDIGIHKVFNTDAGVLSISTNKLFPSMWDGLELLERI
jgi:hypothetical protein